LRYSGSATNGGATANTTNLVALGAIGSTTARFRVSYALLNGVATFVEGWYLGLDADAEDQLGAILGATPSAVLDLGSETAAGYLAATRGPGRRDETFAIVPSYQYGAENVFPVLSPSPDTRFRTTDKSEIRLCFDLGSEARLGYEWQQVLGLLRVNFRLAYWQSSADGASWTTRITYDGADGFTDLTASVVGDHLRAGTGSTSGARALQRNELAGGYAVLRWTVMAVDFEEAYPILGNSAGVWVDPTGITTKLAEIRIAADPAGFPSTVTVDLVWPSAIVHERQTSTYPTLEDRYWRLRVTADQVTPDTYYEIGVLFPGDVAAYGRQVARGWSQTMKPNVQRSRSRYGTIRKREDGPPARRWSMGWTDGAYMLKPRSNDPDYVRNATSTAPALAMRDDVWLTLWGLLEELRSGEVPVMALAKIPSATETVQTDRTLWLYGSLEGDVQFNHVVGEEGSTEFGRIDPIAVDEIR
jgi:hypothetical protein